MDGKLKNATALVTLTKRVGDHDGGNHQQRNPKPHALCTIHLTAVYTREQRRAARVKHYGVERR